MADFAAIADFAKFCLRRRAKHWYGGIIGRLCLTHHAPMCVSVGSTDPVMTMQPPTNHIAVSRD